MPWGADDAGPVKLQQELQALGVRAASLEVDLSNKGGSDASAGYC